VLGPDHSNVLTTRNNRAEITGETGDAGTARDLFAALLPEHERVLHPDHPAVLTTRHNVAAWTGKAVDPAAARDLFATLLPDHESACSARATPMSSPMFGSEYHSLDGRVLVRVAGHFKPSQAKAYAKAVNR